MKLKIIQDPEVKEMADVLNNIFEFDDWDLVFDDLPECGFVNDSTFHYIMWYTCDVESLSEEEITKDIKNNIYNIINSDDYSFVWYENPKMTIKDIYHVQVFWIKN